MAIPNIAPGYLEQVAALRAQKDMRDADRKAEMQRAVLDPLLRGALGAGQSLIDEEFAKRQRAASALVEAMKLGGKPSKEMLERAGWYDPETDVEQAPAAPSEIPEPVAKPPAPSPVAPVRGRPADTGEMVGRGRAGIEQQAKAPPTWDEFYKGPKAPQTWGERYKQTPAPRAPVPPAPVARQVPATLPPQAPPAAPPPAQRRGPPPGRVPSVVGNVHPLASAAEQVSLENASQQNRRLAQTLDEEEKRAQAMAEQAAESSLRAHKQFFDTNPWILRLGALDMREGKAAAEEIGRDFAVRGITSIQVPVSLLRQTMPELYTAAVPDAQKAVYESRGLDSVVNVPVNTGLDLYQLALRLKKSGASNINMTVAAPSPVLAPAPDTILTQRDVETVVGPDGKVTTRVKGTGIQNSGAVLSEMAAAATTPEERKMLSELARDAIAAEDEFTKGMGQPGVMSDRERMTRQRIFNAKMTDVRNKGERMFATNPAARSVIRSVLGRQFVATPTGIQPASEVKAQEDAKAAEKKAKEQADRAAAEQKDQDAAKVRAKAQELATQREERAAAEAEKKRAIEFYKSEAEAADREAARLKKEGDEEGAASAKAKAIRARSELRRESLTPIKAPTTAPQVPAPSPAPAKKLPGRVQSKPPTTSQAATPEDVQVAKQILAMSKSQREAIAKWQQYLARREA